MLDRVTDCALHANHVGLGRPVHLRQRACGRKMIALRIVRHLGPVDAAHIFAPPEDLPDETLDRIERREPLEPCDFCATDDIDRQKQTGIDV